MLCVLTQVIGAPLAAALLSLDGVAGLAGWQWLFIMEGIPTVALGLWMRSALVESPAKAHFLSLEEREWVQQRVAKSWVSSRSGPLMRLIVQTLCCCVHQASACYTPIMADLAAQTMQPPLLRDGVAACTLAGLSCTVV